MNERIKELAEQAGFAETLDYLWECNNNQIERFAELIAEDERSKCCTFLMQLHKKYKHLHNHFHVAAVNLWESNKGRA